jgi:hypothetical protein
MTETGWEALRAPYFPDCCAKVVQPYLEGLGFGLYPWKAADDVCYSKGDIFLELGYWVEDSPRYVLQGGVGIIRPGRALNEKPGLDGIGLWRFAPEWHPGTFSDAQQLEALLAVLRDQVLDTRVRPFWEDRSKLEAMLISRR